MTLEQKIEDILNSAYYENDPPEYETGYFPPTPLPIGKWKGSYPRDLEEFWEEYPVEMRKVEQMIKDQLEVALISPAEFVRAIAKQIKIRKESEKG